MLSKLIKYFTDPDAIARRRTIVTFGTMVASGLIASKGLFEFVCSNVTSKVSLIVCSIDIDALAKFISGGVELLNRPEVGAAAFFASGYALVKGYLSHIRK